MTDTAELAPSPIFVEQKQSYTSRLARDRKKLGRWFVAPTVLLLMLIVIFPLLMQLYVSFTWWTPLEGTPWYQAHELFNSGDNYVRLAEDPRLWGAILRTLVIIIISVPIQFTLGMGLAYLFLNKFPGQKIFYSILLTPMMIVPAVVGLMFFLLFQSTGPINAHLGLARDFSWLTDTNRSIIAVIAADTWQWTPLMFLILLAGMLSVPPDQLLAAKLLGASDFQSARRIILPKMKSVIIIALVLRTVESFKIFDLVYIMTNGGPGVQTETISLFLYKLTFGEFEWSYVAAIGLVILLVLSLIAILGLSFMARKKG